MLTRGRLYPTSKKYTFDTVAGYQYNYLPKFVDYDEYTDGNGKYVRVLGNLHKGKVRIRKDTIFFEPGNMYWLRVDPIEWLVDPSGWWVSKDCLVAGIRFNRGVCYDGYFEQTEMARYLRKYFSQQMLDPEQKVVQPKNCQSVSPANEELTVESVRAFLEKEYGADFLKDFDNRWSAAHSKSAIINAKSRQH